MKTPTREYIKTKEKLERLLAKRRNGEDTKKAARLAGRNAAKMNQVNQ